MNRYTVTLEDDDGSEFTIEVPANSKKQARRKADQVYDDAEVKSVKASDSESKADGKKDDEDSEVEILSVEEVEEDESDKDKDKEDEEDGDSDSDGKDDEEEKDEEPAEDHPYFRPLRRKK